MEKDRSTSIDLVKTLLIYLVVLGHTISGNYMNGITANYEESLRYLIYLIHMPLFFFISGYLIKKDNISKDYIFKKTQYLTSVFILVSLVYYILFSDRTFISLLKIVSSPYNHLWFLEVLILYIITLIFIVDVDFKRVLIMSLILAIIGTSLRDLGFTSFNLWGYKVLIRGIEYFLYFYLGTYLRNYYDKKQSDKYLKLYITLLLLSIFILNLDYKIYINNLKIYTSFSVGFVLLNISLIFFILKFLNHNFKSIFINKFGGSSLFIYLWHYGLLTGIFLILDDELHENIILKVIISLFVVFILYYLNTKLSKLRVFKILGVR